ncbi:Polyketide cyclase / dehydrase and lipid transport [Planctomycetes bacterium Pla163]|uniref:Polyketide cyclase / dehydrase and lipid transport n=1 Tax=Rohdeia mirabilis TaxID=2528008 RepID=A0A518CYY3_9BACT|nr:Polyketide cyclase / dehydrase and lipid transport [Planctomycetes bacterium Pla163]
MITASAEFAHPAATVFAAVARIEEHPSWQRGIESIRVLSGDGASVGSRFAVRVVESGIELDLEGEVVESMTPELVRHVLENSDATLDVTVRVTPLASERCRLDYSAAIKVHSFALKMLRGMIESKLAEKAEADLGALARHLSTAQGADGR